MKDCVLCGDETDTMWHIDAGGNGGVTYICEDCEDGCTARRCGLCGDITTNGVFVFTEGGEFEVCSECRDKVERD